MSSYKGRTDGKEFDAIDQILFSINIPGVTMIREQNHYTVPWTSRAFDYLRLTQTSQDNCSFNLSFNLSGDEVKNPDAFALELRDACGRLAWDVIRWDFKYKGRRLP